MSQNTRINRRSFMIGGSTAALFASAQPSSAFTPLVGVFLAEIVLSLGIRIGARTAARSALSLGTSGLSLSLQRRLGGSVRKLRSAKFDNFSKAEVKVSTSGSLGFGATLFPAISEDGYDCCAPFVCSNYLGVNAPSCDSHHCETMLEGPALFYLGECAQRPRFQRAGYKETKARLIPIFTATDNAATMRAPRGEASITQFATHRGGCDIVTRVIERRGDKNIMAGLVMLKDENENVLDKWRGPDISIQL